MKNAFLGVVFCLFTQVAAAAPVTPVPTGTFDCSLKKGVYQATIRQSQDNSYYVIVRHSTDKDETMLQGSAMVASYRSTDGVSYNLIRLPGSSVELYFDESGHLGLDRDHMNCRRI